MKAYGIRNLILPKSEHFKEMGLLRSNQYQILKYKDVLDKYEIMVDPFSDNCQGYAKKVHEYALGELFLVPKEYPQQDSTPIYGEKGGNVSIDLGNEGLLEKFSQLLYQFDWNTILDGSTKEFVDFFDSLTEEPNKEDIDKIMEWTNRYGLLFSEPTNQSSIENIYKGQYLAYSDSVYNRICADYNGLPYFLGVKAFCELNRYAIRLLYMSWLLSKDNERSIEQHKLEEKGIDRKVEDGIFSEASFINGCINIDDSLEKTANKIMGEELANEHRYHRCKQNLLRQLGRNMSAWVRIEMAFDIKSEDSAGEISPIDTIFGVGKKEWAVLSNYQFTSLFGCMMMEALSSINRDVRYKICPNCKKLFDIAKGRKGKKFCSDGTKVAYENCKRQYYYKNQLK